MSIITLTINGLSTLIKSQWLSEWIKKQDSTICYLHEFPFKYKDIDKLKANGWEKVMPCLQYA